LGYSALLDEATRAGPITYVTLALHDPKFYEFRKSSSRRVISITWRDP